jgi:hypothetical protein
MFDNDSSSIEKQNSNNNVSECLGIGNEEIVNDKTNAQIIMGKSIPSTPIIIIQNDFEYTIKNDVLVNIPEGDIKLRNWEIEAKELIKPIGNQNKGQIARYIARRVRQEFPEYVPRFVQLIADNINAYLGGSKINETKKENEILNRKVPF